MSACEHVSMCSERVDVSVIIHNTLHVSLNCAVVHNYAILTVRQLNVQLLC